MLGIFKKKVKVYEEIVIQEGGAKCKYCQGLGKIMVTYDGDIVTCTECDGRKVTNRIVKYIEH